MSKKKSITIEEIKSKNTVKLTLEHKKDYSRIFKLIAGRNYTLPGKLLVKLKVVRDNEYVIITGANGKKKKLDIDIFFELCILLRHLDDVPGVNMIGPTEVIKKSKK